jgi:hypothetical protein
MRFNFLLLLIFLNILGPNLAFAESADSAVGAGTAAALSKAGKEEALSKAKAYNDKANELENNRADAQKKSDALTAQGDTTGAQAALKQANDYANSRDENRNKAIEEVAEARALNNSEAQDLAARDGRLSTPDSNATSNPGTERVTKSLTGDSGGKVRVDDPASGGMNFICENGICRSDGNVAMPNALANKMSTNPDNTFAISSVDEMINHASSLPQGEPISVTGHGGPDGLSLSDGNILKPGTEDFDRLAEAFKGHPVTFESCSLANVPGFCSSFSAITGDSVTAYDKTMISEKNGFYATEPNTSEHTWQSAGSALAPGEVVQSSLETNQSQPVYYANQGYSPQPSISPTTISNGNFAGGGGSSSSMPYILAGLANSISGAGGSSGSQNQNRNSSNSSTTSAQPSLAPAASNQNNNNSNQNNSSLSNLLSLARSGSSTGTSLQNEQNATNSVVATINNQAKAPTVATSSLTSQNSQNASNVIQSYGGSLAIQTVGQKIGQPSSSGSLGDALLLK